MLVLIVVVPTGLLSGQRITNPSKTTETTEGVWSTAVGATVQPMLKIWCASSGERHEHRMSVTSIDQAVTIAVVQRDESHSDG